MAGSMFEERATRISKAILNNDIAELKGALKDGEDPHYTDRKGNTYLHYVCTMHRPFIFHIIVGTGLDLNARNRHGNTALHVTALQNECFHVGDLMAAGVDPNIRNIAGKTAAEIPTRNLYWKSMYDKYHPGIFEAIDAHDVEKVLYLLHCWSRVDTVRDGQALRQYAASRKFHDLVFHIDTNRHSLGAVYAVLEGDPERAWDFMSHSKCDVNFLNYAAESSHILQHAIKLQDIRLIRMICKSKVDVNVRVTLHGYLKAPLFFIVLDPIIPENIMWTVLKAGADFKLKDERGRNAGVFALDKTNLKISLEVIAYMMKNGLDVSQRDMTGVTFRDVARFARRKDILEIIDKAYVKMIRTSNITELERLSVMGYDSLLIDFNYRDTFIYASGNETEDVLEFVQGIPKFCRQVRKIHFSVCHWSLDKVMEILKSANRPDLLINARDKGGRAAIHLCVLHWRFDVLKMLLLESGVEINAVDSLGRTAYHYACAVEEEDERKEFCLLLENAGIDKDLVDGTNHKAAFNLNNAKAHGWIKKERKTRYGMERQLSCVDKYEELCHMMRYKRKGLKHFEKSVCRFKYPVGQFAKILSPLMPEYQDLVFVAMEKDKEDIAMRLIQIGTDWKRKEMCQVTVELEGTTHTKPLLLSVTERAKQLDMQKVLTAIQKKETHLEQQEEDKKKSEENEPSKRKKQEEIENVRKTRRSHDRTNDRDCAIDIVDDDGDEEVYFEEEEVESASEDENVNYNDNYYSDASFEGDEDQI